MEVKDSASDGDCHEDPSLLFSYASKPQEGSEETPKPFDEGADEGQNEEYGFGYLEPLLDEAIALSVTGTGDVSADSSFSMLFCQVLAGRKRGAARSFVECEFDAFFSCPFLVHPLLLSFFATVA